MINRVRVANHPMRQIALDTTGKNLIANSTDRALRTLVVDPRTGALAPAHRFQDQVNRTPWHAIGFSGDGEYVMGGAGHKMAHNVFVWDRESGVLVIMLGGPREPLIDCVVSVPFIATDSALDLLTCSGTPHARSLSPYRPAATRIYGRLAARIIGPPLHRDSKSSRRT